MRARRYEFLFLLLFFLSIVGNLWLLQIQNSQNYLQVVSLLLNSSIWILLFWVVNSFVKFKTYLLANKDEVSGLYNEKAFGELLSAEIKRLQRIDHPLCVLFFDIDSYKRTNDRKGQKEADTLVKKFSSILLSTIRESDAAGRLNSDTFAVLAIGSNKANIASLLDRVFAQIKKAEIDNLSHPYAAVVQVEKTDNAQSVLERGFGMIFEEKSKNIISMLKTSRLEEDDED